MQYSSDEPTFARDLGDMIEQLHGTDIEEVTDPVSGHKAIVAFVPQGRTAVDLRAVLDAHLPRPRRATGTITAQDVESFIAMVNTFKDTHSRVFANFDLKAPRLLAVLDHHEATTPSTVKGELLRAAIGPRHAAHRVAYACPLSEEWKAWAEHDGKQMSQADFAEFLEDRLSDVVLPDVETDRMKELHQTLGARIGGPSSVMALSRGLEVNVGMSVKQIITLDTGEIQAHFLTEHRDSAGAPIKTPNLFYIKIPVFFNGALYLIPVRLRYRVVGSNAMWFYQMHRPDMSINDAFREVVGRVRDETKLLTVLGSPEA